MSDSNAPATAQDRTSPIGMPLEGAHIIEASAGTGKTYTLEMLFCRLVVEKKVDVKDILVVTFTRAATAEIKDRLRARLAEVERRLETGEIARLPEDLVRLVSSQGDLRDTLALVRGALASFDDAQIFTIHSFCQRILDEHAFVAGADAGLAVDSTDAVFRECLKRFYARHVDADGPGMRSLCALGILPEHKLWRALAGLAMHEAGALFDAPALKGGDDDAVTNAAYEVMSEFVKTYPALHEEVRRERRATDFSGITHAVAKLLQRDDGTFAELVARDYRAVLIDEFQDTDAEQYAIFKTIFIDHAVPGDYLCFVGDPKQSIYRFRNADVKVYAQARKALPEANRWHLKKNYRSAARLLDAMNAFFGAEGFFADPDIAYETVDCGDAGKEGLKRNGQIVPFVRVLLTRESGKGRFDKASCANLAARVHELLDPDNGYTYEGRELTADDIAILVRTHAEIEEVRQALAAYGIDVHAQTQRLITETAEFKALKTFLLGVIYAHDATYVRSALATSLFCASAAFANLDEKTFDEHLSRFSQYREIGRKRGTGYLLERVLEESGAYRALLESPEGRAGIVNWGHLAEILHELDARLKTPEAVLGELLAMSASQVPVDDAGESPMHVRMHKARNVVRVMTYFASKGLEFPVVMLPLLGGFFADKSPGSYPLLSYYDATGQKHFAIQEWLSPEGKKASDRENWADRLRLLYVAVTRASAHLEIADAPAVKLGVETALAKVPSIGAGLWRKLAAKLPDAIELGELPSLDSTLSDETAAKAHGSVGETLEGCAARPGAQPRDRDWAATSYSAIVKNREEEAAHRDDVPAAEAPAFDTQTTLEALAGPCGLPEDDIVFFPRGAIAGEALHAFLEKIDFTDEAAWKATAQEVAQRFFPALNSGRLARMMLGMARNLAAVALFGDKTLSELDRGDRASEMDFCLGVSNAQAGAALSQAMREAGRPGYAMAPLRSEKALAGYLKGFIDLVAFVDGRYWVLDWKSNFLPPRGEFDSARAFFTGAYGRPALQKCMQEDGYCLQYVLYCVALRRYLKARLGSRFDFASQFGGVRYVFLRGARPDLPGFGVWEDRPDEAFLARIEAILGDAR